jgi:LPXTG-motif cell wall-anchored protein
MSSNILYDYNNFTNKQILLYFTALGIILIGSILIYYGRKKRDNNNKLIEPTNKEKYARLIGRLLVLIPLIVGAYIQN